MTPRKGVGIAMLTFRYFLRYFSSTSTEQIFPNSAGPFIVSILLERRLPADQRAMIETWLEGD